MFPSTCSQKQKTKQTEKFVNKNIKIISNKYRNKKKERQKMHKHSNRNGRKELKWTGQLDLVICKQSSKYRMSK